MDDTKRDSLRDKLAQGYLTCLFSVVGFLALGKEYGFIWVTIVLPGSSVLYYCLYRYVCKGYQSKNMKIIAFSLYAGDTATILYVSASYFVCFSAVGFLSFLWDMV